MRKQLKKQALKRMRKGYWMMIMVCLIMAIAGIEYAGSVSALKSDFSKDPEHTMRSDVLTDIFLGRADDSDERIEENLAEYQSSSQKFGIVAIDHSRGVLAQLTNSAGSGQLYKMIYDGMKMMTHSKQASVMIFVFFSIMFFLLIHVFIFSVFKVTAKRVFLEYHLYDKVPTRRFLYLISVKSSFQVALTMLLKDIFQFLWSLTIIGGIIKRYSYSQVPYILAENPTISPKSAITLSRKLMDGHKWEGFKLNLSFLGWELLELFTFGLSGILFTNPYTEMTKAEYYSYLRSLAKENHIPGAELLNDTYLFEKADKETLVTTYADMLEYISDADQPIPSHRGLRGFLENVFGIVPSFDSDEALFRERKGKQLAVQSYKDVCEQNMYPYRLFQLQHKERLVKLSPVQYDRHYTPFSLLLIFFSMSFIGWCWEVSLHLITEGTFRNRGFFHGPWLPIYGAGGVLILVFLYKFREKIFAQFLSAIVLCGFVEYYTAWYMELTNGGTKWWDYTGYFLNIHGRICAEGLLVFGLGGVAIVYLLAPFLDNMFRQIPKRIAIILSIVLLTAFTADVIYSKISPNVGDGITDYAVSSEYASHTDSRAYTDSASNTESGSLGFRIAGITILEDEVF